MSPTPDLPSRSQPLHCRDSSLLRAHPLTGRANTAEPRSPRRAVSTRATATPPAEPLPVTRAQLGVALTEPMGIAA